MNKPSSSTPAGGHVPASRYFDHDTPELQIDDLPPLYTDVADSDDAALLAPADHSDRLAVPARLEDAATGAKYHVDHRLDTDPEVLEWNVRHWAAQPPRPYVRVRGTHQQTVDKKGKKERTTVTDFDVQIELTPYLYSDATNRVSWTELRTVEDGERTKRGSVFKCRAPGARRGIELGAGAKPTLQEWCHLYCASHAGLKAFTLGRRVVGLDEGKMRRKIEQLVRGTNYRGRLDVTFPVKGERVEVYNDCRTNAWRLTAWIQWLCVLTLLFVFTWPYLFFRTKRFEVAIAEWSFSRPKPNGGMEYVSLSEDQLHNFWGRALAKAVLEKRQGTLDQQDLIAAEGAEPTFETGHATADAALGILRAGVNAMNEVNRQLGWGGDC